MIATPWVAWSPPLWSHESPPPQSSHWDAAAAAMTLVLVAEACWLACWRTWRAHESPLPVGDDFAHSGPTPAPPSDHSQPGGRKLIHVARELHYYMCPCMYVHHQQGRSDPKQPGKPLNNLGTELVVTTSHSAELEITVCHFPTPFARTQNVLT